MGMKDNVKSFAARLKLDSHHAIERFGIFFGGLVVVGALLFTGATTTAMTNVNARMDSTVLYTPKFTTSKTQLSGEVTGVYVSTDRTRTMVLMQFKDAASVSSKADNYQAFVTGSASDLATQQLKSQLGGEIVVFGSTGYLGVVLDSDKPFEQQIINLTMRANSELVYAPSDTRKIRDDLADDGSFVTHDQWRLFFNPGASGATETATLDGASFDPGAFYSEIVVVPEELKIRQEMDEQLGQMAADLAVIDEYTASLATEETIDGARLVPAEVPVQIDGDKVIGEAGEGKLTDPEDKTSPIDVSDSTLELVTDWVSPKGFDFDWRGGSVEKGWLDELVPADQTYGSFLAEKANASKNGENEELRVDDLVWTITGGKCAKESLLLDDCKDDKTMKPLLDLRNSLADAYQTYYKDKLVYQVDLHTDLIDLEVDLRNVRNGSSVNDGEKAVLTY